MMKRIMNTLILLLMVSASALCVPLNDQFKEVLQKSFMVQAGYYDFFTLRVVPLSAQSQDDVHGMPFALEGNDIQPGSSSTGRLIAEWQLLSNNPNFILSIEAQPLRHVDADLEVHKQDIAYQTPITYTLNFTYSLSYFNQGENKAVSNSFEIKSGIPQTENEQMMNNPLYNAQVDPGTYVGSADGKIYFKLSKTSYDAIHTKDPNAKFVHPKGYYKGSVVMKMETKN